ncbi:MAG TPA: AMP-binding protein, partial [Spongiibacteraceae bacterium]|nr:AMP-binding protein [Spongiibacteraceae bacterium]
SAQSVPAFPPQQKVAYVFTSGSTGVPVGHAKTWGALVGSVRAAAQRLNMLDGRSYTIIGTVPPQHMYGFESTVLLALQGGAALWAGKPFYPADIAAALSAVPEPRVLVSTPFHLRAFIDAELDCPAVQTVLSATAPLTPELARAVEVFCDAPLLEIYGCTESGQIATRRPTEREDWLLLDKIFMRQSTVTANTTSTAKAAKKAATDYLDNQIDNLTTVEGDFIDGRIELGDIIDIIDAQRFLLRGRSADLINIAGKRTSLAFLNHQLLAVAGVRDGCFLLPDSDDENAIIRLTAFAVADSLSATDIVRALRARIDPVFLPRPLYLIAQLPRNAAGKLPRAELQKLWLHCSQNQLAQNQSAQNQTEPTR